MCGTSSMGPDEGQPENRPFNCNCQHFTVSARPGRFLQPCLLFLLLEQPSHGYGLMERLGEFGLAEADAGGMYRMLNRLEDEGFVTSTWETEGSGPARKEYRVTPAGVELLHSWAKAIRHNRKYVDKFLERYQHMFSE
jgi:PadR family transcriptional regulator PadR